jgi:uncharacterized membrane protein YkvA (DUF1232 family)
MKKNSLTSHGHILSQKTQTGTVPAQSVDSFIQTQAKGMTSARLKELALFHSEMNAKLRSPQAVLRLEFQQQARLLLKILASDEVRLSQNPLPAHLAEVAVAAHYLLKGVDLIPDHVPEIGLADDEIIIRRVFARNPELNQLLN